MESCPFYSIIWLLIACLFSQFLFSHYYLTFGFGKASYLQRSPPGDKGHYVQQRTNALIQKVKDSVTSYLHDCENNIYTLSELESGNITTNSMKSIRNYIMNPYPREGGFKALLPLAENRRCLWSFAMTIDDYGETNKGAIIRFAQFMSSHKVPEVPVLMLSSLFTSIYGRNPIEVDRALSFFSGYTVPRSFVFDSHVYSLVIHMQYLARAPSIVPLPLDMASQFYQLSYTVAKGLDALGQMAFPWIVESLKLINVTAGNIAAPDDQKPFIKSANYKDISSAIIEYFKDRTEPDQFAEMYHFRANYFKIPEGDANPKKRFLCYSSQLMSFLISYKAREGACVLNFYCAQFYLLINNLNDIILTNPEILTDSQVSLVLSALADYAATHLASVKSLKSSLYPSSE